jgi:cardiolipin synthase (CMP-forming)
MNDRGISEEPEARDEAYRRWIFTIPNIICMARMAGSVVMLAVAIAGYRYWFVGIFVGLTVSDWIDGYLARRLRQRSDLGARIDSFADFLLYGSLLFGSIALCYDELKNEWIWILMAVGSYAVTSLAGLIKFGKIPSYHTLAAKRSQIVVLIGGILLVLEIAVWPTRIAALAVFITNVEATLITWYSSKWLADVPSLLSVLRRKRELK